ncbi:MAG TPA: AMP-binding protein [Longimicrobiales bacterium]|nr:AMP-binding protein [Longimicrobiales bacterium]
MTLSILDAAAEAPERDALLVRGERLRFAKLAERVEEAMRVIEARGHAPDDDRPAVLLATPTLESLVELYALIELRVPVHLVHPSLTVSERDALAARATRAGPMRTEADGPSDRRPLAVVYTSGTSGASKGVVLPRRAFVASARASEANLGWRDDDRWLLRIPFAHVGGLSTVTRCLLARRCLVLADDSLPLAEQIERDRVTLVSLVPTLLRRLLDTGPRRPPPHLRAILLGGAHAPGDLLADAVGRGWPVLTTYGLTETCSQVTTQPPGTVNRGELGSGRALPGVELRIVDDVIQVRGPMLFSGYFPPAAGSPFLDDGFFATGDRGRLDASGNLHVLGRVGDLIVTGGENVDPLEVESALRVCAGVADACVFGVPDREWGERVAAAIVPAGDPPHLARLAAELGERLAGFKRPRAFAFVERLPLTASGKVDRREAARRFAARLVDA